jgi:hypothetical protein
MSRKWTALAVCAGFSVAVFTGCRHTNSQPEGQQSQAAAKPDAKAEPAQPTAKPIPKGHVFGKINEGMSDADVAKILGQPTDRHDYVNGKAFIPYYYGSDTSRSDWIYKGKGHVVFSRNRYNGALSVIEVIYDPATP